MRRLALFSSFISSNENKLPHYILLYLQEIRKYVTKLVFIYNEDFPLSEHCRAQLEQLVDDIMPVENAGFDFGMWQKGLSKHSIREYDELCLLNDSCICLKPFDSYFNWHNSCNASVTSLTYSMQYANHLQSYFLCVKKEAMETVADYILKQNFVKLDFSQVIIVGEIGLSLYCAFKGIRLGSLYALTGKPNISMEAPEYLISNGSPLIKKKAIIHNTNQGIELLKTLQQKDFIFLTDIIRESYHLSLEYCHSIFNWLPIYILDGRVYVK